MMHIKMAMDIERYQNSNVVWRWMVRRFGTEYRCGEMFQCKYYSFLGKDYMVP